MSTPKPNNVVEKYDPGQLADHQSGLDQAYRQMQRAYRALTYEVGRLEDEPGLGLLAAKAVELAAIAEKLQVLGQALKKFAEGETHEQEAAAGPQGAD